MDTNIINTLNVALKDPITSIDVIQQLLHWKFAVSMLWFISAVVVFILTVTYTIWFWNKDVGGEDGDIAFFGGVILPLVVLIAGWMCLDIDWLQILIAPKLYLIEYAAHLIK